MWIESDELFAIIKAYGSCFIGNDVMSSLDREADIIARYLVHSPIVNKNVYELYSLSISSIEETPMVDDKILSLAFRKPWLIPFFDSGLVFLRPYSELRRRIYTMFAILESTPEHVDKFLAKKVGFSGTIYAIWAGVRDVLRTVVGIIIIKLGRL